MPILNSFDEIYGLLMLIVERHYLKTYRGSFTENFYGLKREKVLRIKGGEAPRARIGAPNQMRETLQLKERDVWNNLGIMVALPYLKRKLDEKFDIHAPQAAISGPVYNRDSLPHDATMRQRTLYCFKWFLRNVYPSVNAAYYFSLLAFNLAYLFDNTRYSSPLLWLVGTRIRRLSQADHRAIALAAANPAASPPRPGTRPGQASSIFSPATFASNIHPQLISSLKILLPTSIFALKFLEWWHASDFARQLSKKAAEGLDLPPPVPSGLPHPFSQPASSSKSRVAPQRTSKINTVSLSSSSTSMQTGEKDFPISQSSLAQQKPSPPISSTSLLPIYTVPPPRASTSAVCPICLHPVQTATSVQSGYVFCYTCIFKWLDGSHERQLSFMEGAGAGDGEWDDVEELVSGKLGSQSTGNREGKWESGKGRCAVTGRRALGGSDGLRRVMV